MREYTWKEAGKVEGISHKELTSLQMLQYVDWFRVDRKVFEFEKGVELFVLFQYYFEKDEIVNKIPMKSTGTVGIKGIEDEDLKDWKMLYSVDHHKVVRGYY